MRDARRQARQLLTAPTVDRPALEALRAAQLAEADAASRRMVQAIADAAEVLTPEQRAKLAQRLDF
jgi:Spy/CpxP family protein refolding chaperone